MAQISGSAIAVSTKNIAASVHEPRLFVTFAAKVMVKLNCDAVLSTQSDEMANGDVALRHVARDVVVCGTSRHIFYQESIFSDTESVIKARIDREHFCIDADVMASEAVNDRIYADTQSGVLITDKHDADLQANVIRSIAVNADTERLLQAMFSLCADTRTRPYERHALSLTADVKLQVVATVDMCLDMLLHQIKEFVVHTDTCLRLPFDTTFYLPANTGDPYDPFIIPPAREKGGMVRMSIMLNELSLSDAFELETTMPVDVLDGICGTILDFRYHYIISETGWKDSTISASGMYDVDSLLFTPMRYSAGKEKHKASYHAERIAGALSKKLNIAIRDFTHSATWTGGGQTYESIISSLFGWTSSVPHRQINVFLRAADNSINIIQRGYEKNIVDITGVQHTCPEYHRELVRTMWTQDGSAGTAVNKAQNINIEPMPFWGTLTFGDAVCSYESGYLASETVNGEITTYDYEGEPETGKYLHKKTVEHADGSITVTSYDYNLTNGGVKVLGQEEEVTTDKNGNRSVRRTVHAPLGSGFYGTSVYVDGDYQGSSISTGSPAGAASRYLRNEESITLGGAVYSGKEKDDAQNSSLGFIDTASFPVEEESILEELTNEIKWLNRKIKETVNMDIYNYPHVVDFSERIRFRGHEYYLVSNTITRTTRKLKQAVSLVRWY